MEWRVFMNVIKNNKGIFIVLGIILVFIIGAFVLFRTFLPSGNEYGNRLKGIEKVKISKSKISNLEKKIADRKKIKKVDIDIKGRLINILITVEDETDLDDMKDYSTEKLELFKEKELKYYDIQFYLINENAKAKHYPAIGYKHKTSDKIKWSNDD